MGEVAMAVEGLEIETRPGEAEDMAFVFATWLRGFKMSSAFARRVSNTVFFAAHHEIIERILARGADLTIAYPTGDPGVIVGYLVSERLGAGAKAAGVGVPRVLIHWAHTKGNFRGLGVMRTLLASRGIDPGECGFTHLSHDAEQLWRKWPRAIYWPYLMA